MCKILPHTINSSSIADEYRLFRRWLQNSDNSSKTASDVMFDLAYGIQGDVFSEFKKIAALYLLLPVGTATVERCFSTLNRIMDQHRNRLLPIHQSRLVLISAEGPEVPSCELLDLTFKK